MLSFRHLFLIGFAIAVTFIAIVTRPGEGSIVAVMAQMVVNNLCLLVGLLFYTYLFTWFSCNYSELIRSFIYPRIDFNMERQICVGFMVIYIAFCFLMIFILEYLRAVILTPFETNMWLLTLVFVYFFLSFLYYDSIFKIIDAQYRWYQELWKVRFYTSYERDCDMQQRADAMQRSIDENPEFFAEGLEVHTPEVLELFERIYHLTQLTSLIIDEYKQPSSIQRSQRLFTHFNSLFVQLTGSNFLSYYLNRDFDSSNFTHYAIHYATRLFDSISDKFIPTEDDFKSEGLLETLDTINILSTDYLSILDSEFGRKLLTLGGLLVCVPALNSIGIDPIKLGLSDDTLKTLKFDYSRRGVHLPGVILEHTTWLLLKFSQMCISVRDKGVTVGIHSLFVSRTDFLNFEQEYMWLKRNCKNFSCCTEVVKPDGTSDAFTLEGYFNRCHQALEQVDKLLPALKKDPYARNRLERCKYDILNFQSDCAADLRAGESRPFPYAIMLTGPPSVGKSTIKDILFHQLHMSDKSTNRFEIDYNPKLIYTYNPTDDFYSGFSTTHTGILLDDVAQKHPDIIKQKGGDDLDDLIRIINSIPFLPNQAELEKKGKTPMRVRYVIGTTNTPDLSAAYVFKCPGAVYRRMIFVACSVKPEYTLKSSTALRGDDNDVTNLNLWNFVITRFTPQDNNVNTTYWDGSKWILEKTLLDVEQLTLFIDKDLDRHWSQQERAKAATAAVFTSARCEHGISSLICSLCKLHAESDVYDYLLDIIAGALFVPILTLFGITYLHQFVSNIIYKTPLSKVWFVKRFLYPRSFTAKPTLTLRASRYLIGWLPATPMTQRIRWMKFIPPRYHNLTCRVTYYAWYDLLRGEASDLYEWYRTEILHDWRFPVVTMCILGLYALKRIYRTRYVGEAEMMPKPTTSELNHKNHWLRQYHIGVFPGKGSTINEYTLHTQVVLNTIILRLKRSDGIMVYVNGFLLRGNLCVTVNHIVADVEIDEVTMWRLNKSGLFGSFSFKLDMSRIVRIPKRDLLFFSSDKIIPARDMTGYLPSSLEKIHINCPGRLHFVKHDHGDKFEMNYLDASLVTNTSSVSSYSIQSTGAVIGSSDCLKCVYSVPTENGTCGAPLVALQGVHKMIAGIHTAGNKKGASLTRPIYIEDVQFVLSQLSVADLSDNDLDISYVAHVSNAITPMHDKCPLNDMSGEVVVLGSHELPRVSPRTMVAESLVCSDVLTYFKDKGFPKLLHTSPIRCSPKESIKLSMEKAFENANFYPSEIDFCVKAMSEEFLRHFDSEDLARLHEYPMSAAINGVDGIPYLERLNLKTSGGFGHSGPKRPLFDISAPTQEHEVNYILKPDLQDEYNYIIKSYLSGQVANPVFKCSFKDEPITFEKAAKHKVRIFAGSPVAFSLVVRKYLLCIVREFVGHRRLNFEMAIGANAHGMDWDRIYHHVIRHGIDRCFAGDYKNFDKQMSPEIILAAFRVISNILVAAGWSNSDLKIVQGIAYDTAFSTMDLFGTLIRCYGNNPSGHPLTTIINSLVNSLYMRLATRRIFLQNNIVADFSRFQDIMSLVTYGDDNCGTTSAKYPMLNHTSLQRALLEVGIIYTTDDKEAESKGLVPVSNITFLKRRFVYDNTLNRIVAPLVEESLFKSLTVWTYSKAICKQEQLAAVISSVNREYFFYGKEIFEMRHNFLWNLCLKYECVDYLPDSKLLNWLEIYNTLKT